MKNYQKFKLIRSQFPNSSHNLKSKAAPVSNKTNVKILSSPEISNKRIDEFFGRELDGKYLVCEIPLRPRQFRGTSGRKPLRKRNGFS